AVLTMLLVPSSAGADIFQYTTPDGVIHFATERPANAGARVYVRGDGRRGGGGGGAPGGAFVPFAPQDKDVARFTRYDEWIRQAATLYQIPEQLVRAVIKVESDFDPRSVSVSGARGLMQLMPDTADLLQLRDMNDPR